MNIIYFSSNLRAICIYTPYKLPCATLDTYKIIKCLSLE